MNSKNPANEPATLGKKIFWAAASREPQVREPAFAKIGARTIAARKLWAKDMSIEQASSFRKAWDERNNKYLTDVATMAPGVSR